MYLFRLFNYLEKVTIPHKPLYFRKFYNFQNYKKALFWFINGELRIFFIYSIYRINFQSFKQEARFHCKTFVKISAINSFRLFFFYGANIAFFLIRN